MSLASNARTNISASDTAATSAVSTLGNRSGAPRQLSMRSTRLVPGKSTNCCTVKTRLPLRVDRRMASRVPSPSVKAISLLRVVWCVGMASSTSCKA